MDSGIAAVRRPYDLRQFRHPGIPRLTIYHVPNFIDATGWVIYERPRSEGFGLQTVTWHQKKDGERIQNLMTGESLSESPEPTLTEDYFDIGSDWVRSQIAAMMEISIPLHTERPIGLDGESFGVHMRGEFDVEWWCDGPEAWRPLIDWTRECIAYLNQIRGEQDIVPNP